MFIHKVVSWLKKEWHVLHVSHLYHTEESLLAADLNGCYCYICITVVHVPRPVLLQTFERLKAGIQVASSDKALYAECMLACFKGLFKFCGLVPRFTLRAILDLGRRLQGLILSRVCTVPSCTCSLLGVVP